MDTTWQHTHWTDGLPQDLIDAIEYECERQHVDEARRGYLRAGWERARAAAEAGEVPTLELLNEVAGLIEPDNHGEVRRTPVVFDNGGYAVPAAQVAAAVDQAVRFWPGVGASEEDKAYWLKQWLIIHCRVDGNGREAWVLQQWLFNTWDSPEPLIDFGF